MSRSNKCGYCKQCIPVYKNISDFMLEYLGIFLHLLKILLFFHHLKSNRYTQDYCFQTFSFHDATAWVGNSYKWQSSILQGWLHRRQPTSGREEADSCWASRYPRTMANLMAHKAATASHLDYMKWWRCDASNSGIGGVFAQVNASKLIKISDYSVRTSLYHDYVIKIWTNNSLRKKWFQSPVAVYFIMVTIPSTGGFIVHDSQVKVELYQGKPARAVGLYGRSCY